MFNKLKNMSLKKRLIVFTLVFLVIVVFIQTVTMLAFFSLFPSPSPELLENLEYGYRSFLRYFTYGYFCLALAVDYFISKGK